MPTDFNFFVTGQPTSVGTLTLISADLTSANPSISISYINAGNGHTSQPHTFNVTSNGNGGWVANRSLSNHFRVIFSSKTHDYGSISLTYFPSPANNVHFKGTLTPGPEKEEPIAWEATSSGPLHRHR